jgi:hypothetical protein
MADRTPTFADICSAIADGQIAATMEGPMYQINAYELRRYLNRFRSLPIISTAVDQDSSPHPDADNWSVSFRTSVA